jgi:uncharacterized membrane protein
MDHCSAIGDLVFRTANFKRTEWEVIQMMQGYGGMMGMGGFWMIVLAILVILICPSSGISGQIAA